MKTLKSTCKVRKIFIYFIYLVLSKNSKTNIYNYFEQTGNILQVIDHGKEKIESYNFRCTYSISSH